MNKKKIPTKGAIRRLASRKLCKCSFYEVNFYAFFRNDNRLRQDNERERHFWHNMLGKQIHRNGATEGLAYNQSLKCDRSSMGWYRSEKGKFVCGK